MGKIKDQKIVVNLSLNDSDHVLIETGIKIATIFKKEICLLIHNRKKLKIIPQSWTHQLENYVLNIRKKNSGLKVTQIILSESNKVLPDTLADDMEAIMIVASATSFSIYSNALSVSPIPFLFVNENGSDISTFKKIVVGMDLRSENKDSALWSSYFGRFNQSEIAIVAANDRSKEGQNEVAKNLAFSKQLYNKFKLNHKILKGTKSSLGNSFEALNLAQTSGSNLLIILGSSTITPLDWLVGLPERKIVKKAGTLPILIVNPRIDNYILCD